MQSPSAITLNRAGTYVYIVNAKGNSIIECSVNPINGEFNECIDSTITGLSDPQNFFLSKDEKHGFVVNKGNNSITQCAVDPATGKLSPRIHNKNLMFIDEPTDINIVNVDVGISYAYITNFNNNTISHCRFNPLEEALTSCRDSGAKGLDKPTSVAFDAAKGLAFITNSGNNTITQCNVDYKRDGQLTNCINTLASTLGQPADLSFNATPITRAFVINSPTSTSNPVSTISQCAVDATQGKLSKCSNIDLSGEITSLKSAYDINFNPAGSIAYITNYTEGKKGQIVRCNTFADTQKFTSCSDTGATLIEKPTKMAFNKTGTRALIASHIDASPNDESSALSYCHVNPHTGEFSDCTKTQWHPKNEVLSIAFNSDDTQIYLGTKETIHHYAIDLFNGENFQRMENIDIGIEWPTAIVFNSAGTHAYIADFALNKVHLCEVDVTNGQLTQCDDSGAKGLNMPVDVHLSASGDVAYISNHENNLITRCMVDQTNGQFSNCADSGATGLNDPHSIVVFPSFSMGWGFDLH
jgi:6-phosphogluconolactonase (cycloisomerase 2 family)